MSRLKNALGGLGIGLAFVAIWIACDAAWTYVPWNPDPTFHMTASELFFAAAGGFFVARHQMLRKHED